MFIVDAHLDLAYNAVRGRDVLRSARQQTADSEGIPSVGLPDLRGGHVGLICATIFCAPDSPSERGYRTPDDAHAMAMEQLQWYERAFDDGQMSRVTSRSQLPSGQEANGKIASILLLEGADPIRTAEDLPGFFDAGVRIVGLAWRQTRYAGGTGAPGPLTAEGIRLVKELDK